MSSPSGLSASLNPPSARSSIISSAIWQANLNAGLTLLPCVLGVLGLARTSPAFARSTSASSRTALAITPAFFVWALSGEMGVINGKREDGNRNALVRRHLGEQRDVEERERGAGGAASPRSVGVGVASDLYRSEVGRPARIVAELNPFHRLSNFLMDHPVRRAPGLIRGLTRRWTNLDQPNPSLARSSASSPASARRWLRTSSTTSRASRRSSCPRW